jgi:large subunit ribosomal protein L19
MSDEVKNNEENIEEASVSADTQAQAETVAEEAEQAEAVAEVPQETVAESKPRGKNLLSDIEKEILEEQLTEWTVKAEDGNDEGAMAANLKKEEQMQKARFPEFNVGDTVKVYVWIREGAKQRVQPYEGVVIAMKHGGITKTFTVRRISYEVAVERVFPYYSPYIEKIELVRRGRVRRAKLYYLRGRFGKAAKIREKVVAKTNTTAASKK